MPDYNPKIDIAIKFVLRNTLIVDSLSTARNYMGGVRLVTLRGDVTEAGGAMIGGSSEDVCVIWWWDKGASEIERLSNEIEKLQLMSDTVTAALHQARREQQQLRMKINELTDSDQAVRLQEWRLEVKQAKTSYNKSLGEVAEQETKLSELEKLASQQIDALDAAQSSVANLNVTITATREEMEASSPTHLKDRLHAAQMKRVDAEGIMAQRHGSASGSEHENLLNQRVNDLMPN